MLSSPDAPLKAASCVCKRWRAIVLPSLFRHVLWTFDRWDLVFPETGAFDATGNPTNLPLLSFIRDNGLGRCVESLTLIVSDRMYGQYRLSEAGNASTSGEGSSTDTKLEEDMRSLLTDARARAGWTSRWRQHSARSEDSNWLWELLFATMDPKRFTILALPRMLASLLSRMLFLGDAWSFNGQYHILSLDRRTPQSLVKWKPTKHQAKVEDGRVESNASTPADPSDQWGEGGPVKPIKTVLFTIRPWTSVQLNEGSSTRVYKTHEFFLKRPPSILGSLLGCEEAPNDEPLIPPSVRSLSYVAIFPLSSHFNSLVNHLPKVDCLYIQLVPQNDILDDKEEMRNIQVGDLWMERNTCYSLVMRAMFGAEMGIGWDDEEPEPENGWQSLRVFESGDAADKEAWDMAVEYVRMSGTSWTVMGDGVLIKGGRAKKEDGTYQDQPSPAGSSDSHGDSEGEPSPSFELLSVSSPS